jgi:hypothetical protein
VNDVTLFKNSVTSEKTFSITFRYKLILKKHKMRKTIFIGILMIFTLSSTMAFAGKTNLKSSDNSAVVVKTENKLSAEEVALLKTRVEAIRDMDKTNMTVTEKRELRKELKGIKENVRKSGEVIYISGGTILLIILIIILI